MDEQSPAYDDFLERKWLVVDIILLLESVM